MKKYIHSFLFSLVCAGIFIGSTSCERKLKKQPDLGSNRLFIVSLVTPQDTQISVKVYNMLSPNTDYSFTNDYNSSNQSYDPNKITTNATVTMSDGTSTVALSYDPKKGCYTANASALSIQEGTICSLEVSAPGKLTATASCTIPKRVQNLSAELDSTADGFGGYRYYMRAQWQDNPEEGNYYLADQVDKYNITQDWFFPYALDSTHEYVNSNDYWSSTNKSIISDEGKNNFLLKQTTVTMSLYLPNYEYSYYSVWYSVYSIDEHFVKYDLWQRNLYVDPFVQPSLVHTNVKNGLGVFSGAYKNSTLVKRRAP